MKLYARILSYLGPYGPLVAAALIATVGFAALDAFSLLMLIPLMNTLFGEAPLAGIGRGDELAWLLENTIGRVVDQSAPADQRLFAVCLFILGVFLVKNVFDFFQQYLVVRLEQSVTHDLRNQVYDHLLELDLRFFGRTRAGQIINRLTYDADQLRTLVTRNISKFATSVLEIVFVVVMLVMIHAGLTVVALVVLPLMFGIWRRFIGRLRRGDRNILHLAGEVASHLQETVAACVRSRPRQPNRSSPAGSATSRAATTRRSCGTSGGARWPVR